MLADRRDHDVQVVQTLEGRTIAGFARGIRGSELEVPLIRVAPGSAGANVMARQLLFSQRKHAADHGLELVRVNDPHMSRDVRESLSLEHFVAHGEDWICRIRTGLVTAAEAGSPELLSRDGAIAFESAYWPVKVVEAEIETFLVPIKVVFAEALLDPGLAEQSLFPRQIGLGLNREHVYYRSTQNARGIRKGARVLWYVTGGSPVHPRGSVRAISRVADVVVGKPRTLYARFERFGVYSLEQVSRLKDGNGEVMAIRFVDTEVLESPMAIEALQNLWTANGERFFPPQSPTAIGEHMFRLVYRRSSRYAG
jgi:hypothetical protein